MMPKKICIVGLRDYPMLTGDPAYGYIGGESVQHVLLARAWRDLGLDVSMIVYDHGQPRHAMVDGIRAVAAFAPQAGIFGLRFFHPRLSSVWRAMREIDADVYYQSPAGPWAGLAAGFARTFDKRFILRIASDSDCRRGEQPMRYRRDRWMYDYGVRHATIVAVQTEQQRELISCNYGVRSEILNIVVAPPPASAPRSKDVDVLWVGNFRLVKRADLAIELARRLPHYRFVLVGGRVPGGEAHYDQLAGEAKKLPNVVMTGGLPYRAADEWFDRARLHVNTSDYEGFPNTFVQAWVRGVPVVSFFDPDRVIERRGLGRRCADLQAMCAGIDDLLSNPAELDGCGERAREFAHKEYCAPRIAGQYLELLNGRRTAAPAVKDHAAENS
jgi:glycosyltransferase involved in cell wall biosynthesis